MLKIRIVILLYFLSGFLYGQDLITKKNGEDIKAKVVEITDDHVKYKRFENIDGPLISIKKKDVLIIRYSNGTNEIFSNEEEESIPPPPSKSNNTSPTNQNFFLKGQMDADRNYNGYKGAATGVFVSSLLSPIVGLIPAIATSSTTPKIGEEEFMFDDKLFNNPEYYMGYTTRAKKIKSGKVWKNWGIAFGINIVAYSVAYSFMK